MSYRVHDYVYNHSKSHGDLLNQRPNFLGPKVRIKTGLVHIIKNSVLIRLPQVHTGYSSIIPENICFLLSLPYGLLLEHKIT